MVVGWMLSSDSVSALVGLPETGMGFQLLSGRIRDSDGLMLVLNSELAYDISELDLVSGSDPGAIFSNSARVIEAIVRAPILVGRPEPHSFALLATRVTSGATPPVAPPPGSPTAGIAVPSTLVKSYVLSAHRVFHRFSAFNPDRRVNPNTGDFVAGIYAAPESEVPFVPTGFAAVGRFALPNVQPASHHYVIEAPSGTSVTFGTVAPAFGQAGGGVEVLFTAAVKNNAVPPTPPSKIPDE